MLISFLLFPWTTQEEKKYKYNYKITQAINHIREGNGNPLQCSCLGNPRDVGAWWAAVYGVAQSQTQLSDLAAAVAA